MLTPATQLFVLTLAAGGTATDAYLLAHPNVQRTSAKVEACKLQKQPEVAAALAIERAGRLRRARLDGDELLGRLSEFIHGDYRDLHDENGKLLRIDDWPEWAATMVEALDGDKVKFPSKLQALFKALEITGKTKGLGDGVDALAAAIRADLLAHGEHHE